MRTIVSAVLTAIALGSAPDSARAQIDYRNLDDERPVATEDAYSIERYGFELLTPYRFEAERGGTNLHLIAPELEYGPFSNTQVSLEALLAAVDRDAGTDWGLAGLQLSSLYNFNTETPGLPALALRANLSMPVGNLAGDAFRLTLKAIGTRSWGSTRAHLNAGVGLGSDDSAAAVEPAARWQVSAAVDHTILRHSVLVIGELLTERAVAGAPIGVRVSAGVRWQWTPTLVLDGGITRRLGSQGPDFGITVGLAQAFAIAGLMPGGAR